MNRWRRQLKCIELAANQYFMPQDMLITYSLLETNSPLIVKIKVSAPYLLIDLLFYNVPPP